MGSFTPATKFEAKLRLAVVGPSGSGKTWTSLAVAENLANGGGIAVVDTEHGSASKYSGIFDFDVMNMDAPFHPERFIKALRAAENEGYDVVVLDSISHAWNGQGGLLEIVDMAAKKFKGNTFAAWSEGTPIHNDFTEAIVGSKIHVIATMRSKTEYILAERDGKQVPQKVGLAPIQRDGMEYLFDVVLQMDMENNGIVDKTRCPQLTGKIIPKPGKGLAQTLLDWLSGAAPPAPEELHQMAVDAARIEEFAYATYRLPVVNNAFDGEEGIVAWADYLGAEASGENGLLLAALMAYVNAIADGAGKREAIKRSQNIVEPLKEADKADEEE